MALKICPFCAEEIQGEAIICKHCKLNLSPAATVPENTEAVTTLYTSGATTNETACIHPPGGGQQAHFIFNWGGWTWGKRIVFISACTAVCSLFLNWVEMGVLSSNGLSQGAFLFLVIFIYPCIALFRNARISAIWGGLCALLGVGGTIAYICSKSGEILGTEVNAAGPGAYLFLLCSVAMGIGAVLDYTQTGGKAKECEVGMTEESANQSASSARSVWKKVAVVVVTVFVAFVMLLGVFYAIGKNTKVAPSDTAKGGNGKAQETASSGILPPAT